VEKPRTDEKGVSAAGREQPAVEPKAKPPVRDSGPVEGARGNREVPPTELVPEVLEKPVADAPDQPVGKTQAEEPPKPDTSGGEG